MRRSAVSKRSSTPAPALPVGRAHRTAPVSHVRRARRTAPVLLLAGSLAAWGALAGCAGHRPGATGNVTEIQGEALEVVAGDPADRDLASMNAAELFATGTAAFAAGEYERAARAFDLRTAVFPEAERAEATRFNAGLAWFRMGEYLAALERFRPLLSEWTGADRREVAFRTAESLYHLEDYRGAAELLHGIAEDPEVTPAERIRALAEEGVCLLEAGEEKAAENRLRKATGRWHIEDRRGADLDLQDVAKARFFLGELYRLRFEQARLDPAATDLATLAEDLEHKASLLLSAQGHYLRAIRLGEGRWATASGYSVGRLYEALYRQLMSARLPGTLGGAGERTAYLELLRERIRILLDKAMDAYEGTLAAAERIGVEGPWRERVEAGFARVRAMLLELDAPPAEQVGA